MTNSNWRSYVAFGVALLLSAGVALAQDNTGNIFVKVTDTTGAALPGVTVEISGFGANQIQVTGGTGEARFLRLDPGDWSLEASLDGFSTVEYPSINVRAARNTTVEVRMDSAIQEVITVTSESALLDERRLTAGATISQIELEKIPTARDPWSVLSQTPGVTVDRINVGGNESGQQSTFRGPGASDDENAFMVDGVEVTDMAAIGASSTYYDFDQFTEMQFSTGGTDVSKSVGGVSVNLVTKRGTNEFRGSARFLVTDSNAFLFFKQSNPDIPDSELADDQPSFIGNSINKIEEWGFEAGGPVVRDRLWFWGSHGQNDIKNLTGGTTPSDVQPDDTILTNTAFKVNAQISAANSFTGSWNNGDKEKFGRNASPTRPQPTTWDQRGPSAIIKFEDTHVFNSNFFLTGGYSKVDGGFSLTSKNVVANGIDNADFSFRDDDGVWQGSFWSGGSARPSDEFKVDGSYFFNTGDTSHELKFGARMREFERQSTFGWANDNAWAIGTPNNIPDQGSVLFTQRGYDPPLTQEYTSAWVQDTISAGSWTINAGLRYDLQEGTNDAVSADANPWFPSIHPSLSFDGESAPFDWTSISPRIGITYALGEERKTLLRASFARFPEQLDDDDIDRTNPAGKSYLTLLWYDTDGSGDFNGSTLEGNGPDEVSILGTSGFDLDNPTSLTSPNITDTGFDPEMTDELLLGVEHAVLPEFVVGAQLTWRQITDIEDQIPLVRDANGNDRLQQASDYVLDPSVGGGSGVATGALPDGSTYSVPVYTLNPGLSYTGGQVLRNGDREREYLGANLNFTKRLSNQWMLRGYLQYGEAEWDVPGSFSALQSPNVCEDDLTFGCQGANGGMIDGGLFAVQSAGSGAKADVWIQSGWQYNVNGMYQVAPDRPWGFNVAANIFGREGYPLPYFLDITTSDGQSRDILAVNTIDNFRVDDILTVDLRLDKEFAASGDVSFTFGIDAFNLLNENSTMQRERGLSRGTADWLRETLSPRIWRLSARVNWK
jgi:hypothetical protein